MRELWREADQQMLRVPSLLTKKAALIDEVDALGK
jgi:hypothetical protein